jgi:uncharacterized repeat protein (TIGR03803 family)
MRFNTFPRATARSLLLGLLILGCALKAVAADTFDPSTHQLTIPRMNIGAATYMNMVVTVGTIVSAPNGTSPNGLSDIYLPLANELVVPDVNVGSNEYFNVVVTLTGLLSLGSVSGADTYDGSDLSIPLVAVGSTYYSRVVLAVTTANIVRVAGGLPSAAHDVYDAQAGQLTIAAVQVGGNVYTNVTLSVTPANIVSIGGQLPMESTLYAFNGGASPHAPLIQANDGNFYGTTTFGGTHGAGSVFKITPQGAETQLYSFIPNVNSDGNQPLASLLQASDGNFYGTAQGGGAYTEGVVFKITPSGTESVLHSFSGNGGIANSTDGALPFASLIEGRDHNLYGTTQSGGVTGGGTVFRITLAGVATVLYSFNASNGTDGVGPVASLIQGSGSDDNFYGTTFSGGVNNAGTVFTITLAGTETVLHSFGAGDGSSPSAGVIEGTDGNLYGTTQAGGTNGHGTVFRTTKAGVQDWLYSFTGEVDQTHVITSNDDGAEPFGGLIQGSDGNFYGTTKFGGEFFVGTVFRITPAGTRSTLTSFDGIESVLDDIDGSLPLAGLVQGTDGNLYGITSAGGAYNSGTVFRLTHALAPP